jgi:hypothetical protein
LFNRGAQAAASGRPSPASRPATRDANRPPDPILFQQFFKSVGPRTYVAQVKTAGNGNPYLVLTEGKRDDATGEVRKTRLFVFSEDFDAFLALLRDTAAWLRAHPVPEDIRRKRERFWAKQAESAKNVPTSRDVSDASIAAPPSKPASAGAVSRSMDAATRSRTAAQTRGDAAPEGSVQQPRVRSASAEVVVPSSAGAPRGVAGRFAASHPPMVAAVRHRGRPSAP